MYLIIPIYKSGKMLREAAGVHEKMAAARKAFNEDVDKTFVEDLRNFINGPLADALVRFILPNL